jgi:hypothetical protein
MLGFQITHHWDWEGVLGWGWLTDSIAIVSLCFLWRNLFQSFCLFHLKAFGRQWWLASARDVSPILKSSGSTDKNLENNLLAFPIGGGKKFP